MKPVFEFEVPKGYIWLLDRDLVDFQPHSQLQPWYYLDNNSVFSATQKWPKTEYSGGELIAFAKRQDCDDMACFDVWQNDVKAIVVIHGWTAHGFEVIARYDDFWNWLKSVIDDMAEWVSA
jgi:hypothetical protein